MQVGEKQRFYFTSLLGRLQQCHLLHGLLHLLLNQHKLNLKNFSQFIVKTELTSDVIFVSSSLDSSGLQFDHKVGTLQGI